MSPIQIFPWDDKFDTGLPKVDEQHRKLVALLNDLANQFTGNPENLDLENIFSELLAYTVYHFETEEAIWNEYLPGNALETAHHQSHLAFVDKLHALIAEQRKKPVHEVADQTLGFLSRWLASHILESDRHMAYLVQGLSDGLDLQQAETRATEQMSGFTRQMIDIVLSIYGTLSSNTLRLMRELSHQKELENRLERQHSFFRNLIQALPDLVWMKDPDGVYLACNSRFQRFFGTTEAKILGKTDYDFVDREQADFFRANDQAAIDNGVQTVNEEWITFADDGHRELLETTKTPMFDAQGQLIGVLGIGHNITARKAADAALLAANERLEEAQRLGQLGHWELDLQTHHLSWSDQIFEIFGMDPAEFDASYETFLGIVHPDDRAMVERVYQRSVENGDAYDVVHRIIRKDNGEVRHVHERSREIRDEQGKPLRSLGTVQDISARMLAEQQTEQHQLKLQEALRKTVQAVAYTVEKRDPYTAGHQHRVAELAVAIAEQMGLDPETIEGIRLGSIIHDLGKISIPAEILSRPGRLSDFEFEMIKTHSAAGYEIVKDIDFPWPVAQMILQHHERLDGSGYPQGLRDEQIILEARILAVADVVEAMSSHRPYRAGLGTQTALDEIERHRGTLYDEIVVDNCVRVLEAGFAFSGD